MATEGFTVTFYRSAEERPKALAWTLGHFSIYAWEMDWPGGVVPEIVDRPFNRGIGVRTLGWQCEIPDECLLEAE
jgi:hypothetical protein